MSNYPMNVNGDIIITLHHIHVQVYMHYHYVYHGYRKKDEQNTHFYNQFTFSLVNLCCLRASFYKYTHALTVLPLPIVIASTSTIIINN